MDVGVPVASSIVLSAAIFDIKKVKGIHIVDEGANEILRVCGEIQYVLTWFLGTSQ